MKAKTAKQDVSERGLIEARLRKNRERDFLFSHYRREIQKAKAAKGRTAVIDVVKKYLPKIDKLNKDIKPPLPPRQAFLRPGLPDIPDAGRFRPVPPRGLGLDRLDFEFKPVTICDVYENYVLENAAFSVFERSPASPDAVATERSGKSASAKASAGNAFGTPEAFVSFGYISALALPEVGQVISLKTVSSLNAGFSWAEANPVSQGFASVAALSICQVVCYDESGNLRLFEAPAQTLVSLEAQDEILGGGPFSRSSRHELRIDVPQGYSRQITVYEVVELRAYAPNEHAYISGSFTWNPTEMTAKAGCRTYALVPHRRRFMDAKRK